MKSKSIALLFKFFSIIPPQQKPSEKQQGATSDKASVDAGDEAKGGNKVKITNKDND